MKPPLHSAQRRQNHPGSDQRMVYHYKPVHANGPGVSSSTTLGLNSTALSNSNTAEASSSSIPQEYIKGYPISLQACVFTLL
jgi:hypothetical protein